jgi:hypothetical protein
MTSRGFVRWKVAAGRTCLKKFIVATCKAAAAKKQTVLNLNGRRGNGGCRSAGGKFCSSRSNGSRHVSMLSMSRPKPARSRST